MQPGMEQPNMPTLRTWAGCEDSPAAILKTECRNRNINGILDSLYVAIQGDLEQLIGQEINLEGLRNLIHFRRTELDIEMSYQEEEELAQELMAVFGI